MDHTQPTTDEGGPNGSNTEQPQIADAESPSAEDASPEIADAADTPSADEKENGLKEMQAKWPGWPGYTVYRIVVPVLKVGSIIGRKGDLIKKLVEETRARVRILEGPLTSPDLIVVSLSLFFFCMFMSIYVYLYSSIARIFILFLRNAYL